VLRRGRRPNKKEPITGDKLKIWENRSKEDAEDQIYVVLRDRFDAQAIILTSVDYDGNALIKGSILGINNEEGTVVTCADMSPKLQKLIRTNDDGEPIVE